jgi:ABC-type multidrug transport system, ATPase component
MRHHSFCPSDCLQYSGHLCFNKDGTIGPHDTTKAGKSMIELRNISKTYAKSGTKAVDSLTLQIPEGVIYGFLGPNGAGKTTTIRIMTGAIAADSGSVLIDGIDLAKVRSRPNSASASSPTPPTCSANSGHTNT